MTDKSNFLLPSGFRDLLPADAAKEYFCTQKFIGNFRNWGYELVSTPLLEFATSLFSGAGNALEPRTLKLTDPASQKIVGIRADITTQVARLAKSRMEEAELPLRLCYAGDIVRSYALNTRGQRQLRQAGLELFDKKPNPSADAEIAIIAIESLLEVGLKDITIDLNAPGLVGSLGIGITPEISNALAKRDLAKLPKTLAELAKASGNAEKSFAVKLPAKCKKQLEYLRAVYDEIRATKLPVNITADFAENRGFEYHNTFSFSLFAKNIRDELGRGGRYSTGGLNATGFTIYINSFSEKITAGKPPQTRKLKAGAGYKEIKALHKKGIVTKKLFSH